MIEVNIVAEPGSARTGGAPVPTQFQAVPLVHSDILVLRDVFFELAVERRFADA